MRSLTLCKVCQRLSPGILKILVQAHVLPACNIVLAGGRNLDRLQKVINFAALFAADLHQYEQPYHVHAQCVQLAQHRGDGRSV